MKAIVITGPETGRAYQFVTETVRIGREGEGIDLDLHSDPAVSRNHAALLESAAGRHVEDLGSLNGTWLNGDRLAPGKPRAIESGDLLRVGDTCLALGSDGLRHAWVGQVHLCMELSPLYGYCLLQSRVPLVRNLTLWNASGQPSEEMSLRFEVLGEDCSQEFRVPCLEGREHRRLSFFTSLLAARRLEGEVGLTPGTLRVLADGAEVLREEIGLIGAWDWPHLEHSWNAVVAYIDPDCVSVRSIRYQFGTPDLRAIRGVASAEDSKSPDEAALLRLEELFRLLSQEYEIRYARPRIHKHVESGATFQTLRSPEQILNGHGERKGIADCVDLALIVLAYLESIELSPVLLLCGADERLPEHAVAGCWVREKRRFHPILTREAVLDAVSGGELIVVEPTGVCTGRHRLSFSKACREGGNRLRESRSVRGLDVRCLRPPMGSIVPLQRRLEPPVSRAFWEAERLRDRKGGGMLETSHLLHGAIVARGPVIARLLKSFGLECRNAATRIEEILPIAVASAAGDRTTSFEACEADAARNARTAAVRQVRESDLLWAILDSSSEELDRIFGKLGLEREALKGELMRCAPRPVIKTNRQRIRRLR